mmetsp:Transcript_62348/g.184495  ORF Transcript_62348/g.184495 Transcript_62348/m.184495 type:complete len:208 (-) Transcript_62348:186-809(-)
MIQSLHTLFTAQLLAQRRADRTSTQVPNALCPKLTASKGRSAEGRFPLRNSDDSPFEGSAREFRAGMRQVFVVDLGLVCAPAEKALPETATERRRRRPAGRKPAAGKARGIQVSGDGRGRGSTARESMERRSRCRGEREACAERSPSGPHCNKDGRARLTKGCDKKLMFCPFDRDASSQSQAALQLTRGYDWLCSIAISNSQPPVSN